jgi:short-subunit dehydrogenase
LLRLLEQLAPPMVERGRGGLLLMSSMSGFQGTSMVGTYAGTKAFVTVLGESLWQELGPQGVDVLVCAAGATLTPNFKDQTPVKRRKQAMPMEPRDVAEGALDALGRAGPTWVPGATNRLAYHAFRLLGRRRAVSFVSATTDRMYRSEP